AGFRDGVDQERAQFLRKRRERIGRQRAELRGRIDRFESLVRHQWVRSTIQSASSARRRPRAPNGTSASCAARRNASARRFASCKPRSVTYVGLSCAASLPAVLPSVAAEPSTSSTSSTTWKERPAQEAN